MKNLKLVKLYTLVPKDSICNFVVFDIYTNEEKFNQFGFFSAIPFYEADISQFFIVHDDPQTFVSLFEKKVDKLIKSDRRTVFITSHHGRVTSSGSTEQDVFNLRQAITEFCNAYVIAYQKGYRYGFDELYGLELDSHKIFTDKELTQFNSEFEQLGYNTGKRVGVTEGREAFKFQYGF